MGIKFSLEQALLARGATDEERTGIFSDTASAVISLPSRISLPRCLMH